MARYSTRSQAYKIARDRLNPISNEGNSQRVATTIAAERQQRASDRDHAIQNLSLFEFVQQGWAVLEPGREFYGNWHQELICEYLEEVSDGNILKLLINLAPRHLKSRIVSVFWPCWEWIENPWLRYLCLSYAGQLATDHNQDRQMLIESDWYQKISGGLLLSNRKNRMTEFENSKRGVMRARGLDGSVTGSGGDRLICLRYNTLVSTSVGNLEIGRIVEDELNVLVKTFNHATGVVEFQPILRYEQAPSREMVEIDLGDRVLECTVDHPVWVEGVGYVKAGDIQPGDVVLVDD